MQDRLTSTTIGCGKNYVHSVEYWLKGAGHKMIAYGRTREDVIHEIANSSFAFNVPDWMDRWVVMPTRIIPRGLGSQWTRAPRGYDRDYYMI